MPPRGETNNPDIDAYIDRSEKWPSEMIALRDVLLGCGLAETIKWGKPCFSHDGKNIAIMQEMNEFLALMFFKACYSRTPGACSRNKDRTRDLLDGSASARAPTWPS